MPSALHVLGVNGDVDASEETIWSPGGSITYPSSETAIKVSSGSNDDDAAGTGARTVEISGLDGDYAPISETIEMDGQTAVTTENTYLRILGLRVLTAGSGGVNAGIVYAGTGVVALGVPAVVHARIEVGLCRLQAAITTVPYGQTLKTIRIWASELAGKKTKIRFYTRPYGGVFELTMEFGVYQDYAQHLIEMSFAAKTDIEMRALSADADADVAAGFDGWY